MPIVALGLGSNLGNRLGHLCLAVKKLQDLMADVRTSSVYISSALVKPDAPPHWNNSYLNAVIYGKTDLLPLDLLKKTQEIELELGRGKNNAVWSPREIDIDILLYGNEKVDLPELTIPHKELKNRDFVMVLLAEIMPESFSAQPSDKLKKTDLCLL